MNNNQFLIEMGQRITKRRKELNKTQEQIAEFMNISIQSLSCIELGKKAIRPENLYNLCIALDISPDYILMGKKSPQQLEGIQAKLSTLRADDYSIIENLIDHLNNR